MSALRKKPAGIGVFRMPTEQERSQYVASLLDQWEKQVKVSGRAGGGNPFVTIARQVGCTAFDLGLKLADRLNRESPSGTMWSVYDKGIVHEIAQNLHLNERLVETLTERSNARIAEYVDIFFKGRPTADTVIKEAVRVVRHLCEKGHSIVIGRGGCVIGAEFPKGLHLRLTAPFVWRVENFAAAHGISLEEAEQRVRILADEREDLFHRTTGKKVSDPDLFDMTLNMARFSPEALIDVIVAAMKGKGLS